jgi:hypothetical protein
MITENNISEFRADLLAAVKPLESKYGEVMVDPVTEINACYYLHLSRASAPAYMPP